MLLQVFDLRQRSNFYSSEHEVADEFQPLAQEAQLIGNILYKSHSIIGHFSSIIDNIGTKCA